MFVSPDESQRRAAEEALAADLTAGGAHGVPAYALLPLPNQPRGDAEAARVRLKEAGANGVVVMRVVGKDQRIAYTSVDAPASNSGEVPALMDVRHTSKRSPTPSSRWKHGGIRSIPTSFCGRARAAPSTPRTSTAW